MSHKGDGGCINFSVTLGGGEGGGGGIQLEFNEGKHSVNRRCIS